MPRYHFDIKDRPPRPDHDGSELADDAAAREAAVRLIGAYMIENPEPLLLWGEVGIHVRRSDRRTVFVISCVAVDTSGA